nr:unnamed protein product [Spirometra erinaceieuropaei]
MLVLSNNTFLAGWPRRAFPDSVHHPGNPTSCLFNRPCSKPHGVHDNRCHCRYSTSSCLTLVGRCQLHHPYNNLGDDDDDDDGDHNSSHSSNRTKLSRLSVNHQPHHHNPISNDVDSVLTRSRCDRIST